MSRLNYLFLEFIACVCSDEDKDENPEPPKEDKDLSISLPRRPSVAVDTETDA